MFSTSLSSTTEYEYGSWEDYDLKMGNPAPGELVQIWCDGVDYFWAGKSYPTLSEEIEWKSFNGLYNDTIKKYRVVKVKQPQQEKTEMETSGILTAAQAKEKAEAVNNAAEYQEKERIANQVMDLISSASAQGKFKVRLPYYMCNYRSNLVLSDYFWLVDLLNDAGYNLYTDDEENNDMTIWWK